MATLEERLRLVVDATTGSAGAEFGKLTTEVERTAKASDIAAGSVASAADAVIQARAREGDAIGKLSVAQARLDELRAKGTASTSQLVAAEEKVAAAQRQVQIAAGKTSTALERQTEVQEEATEATDEAGDGAGRFGEQLSSMRNAVAGLVAGVSLADWLSDSVSGFMDGARSAQAMATSMNATVAEAGAFLGLVGSVGLEMDDLIEIQAEFATKSRDGMTQVGTRLKENADGTVNWTTTLVDALAELQKMPDATERNRVGFSMFGEEGYKQLSRLLNTGVDVEDALERIGTPLTEEDVAAVREFDEVMYALSSTSGELGRTIGRAVLPLLTGLITGARELIDVVGAVPAPIGLAAVAAVGLGIAMRVAGVQGGLLALGAAQATFALGVFRAAAATTIAANGILGASFAGARAAASGAMGLIGGPLGLALIAAGTAFYFASQGSDDLEANAKKAALALAEVEKGGAGAGKTLNTAANDLEENAGYWERSAAYVKGYQEDLSGVELAAAKVIGPFQRLTMGFGDTADTAQGFELSIEEARKELGEFGAQQEIAQIATRSLSDMIAAGTTEGEAFTSAVRDAAEAQADEARTSDLTTAALAAYNATTRDAVQTTLDLFSAQLGQRDGAIGVQKAFYELSETIDDTETPWNEVTEATNQAIEATLTYAGTAADAAVEAARAAGKVLDPLAEAKVRAEATIGALKESLKDPNMTASAREQVEALIGQLETAQGKGDITALLTLTGADETKSGIDDATKDRDTEVRVETRNGPAVVEYLDRITAERLTLIRVETRNGPAVDDYLGHLSRDRLALIRVETRNGPAVEDYLDRLTRERTAIINASRGAGLPAAGSGMYGAPGLTSIGAGAAPRVMLGSVTLDLELTGTVDRRQAASAERGRAAVADVRAYERENGTGWRSS